MHDQLNLTGLSVDSEGNLAAKSFTPDNDVRAYVTKTANYSADGSEGIIAYTALAAGRTVTLPLANTVPAGTQVSIRDWANNAGTNNITIAKTGSDTLVGPTTINTNGGHALAVSDGVDKWYSNK